MATSFHDMVHMLIGLDIPSVHHRFKFDSLASCIIVTENTPNTITLGRGSDRHPCRG